MENFKIGDRVVCIRNQYHIQVGDTGTILENSLNPWVRLDKFNEDNHHGSNVWGDNYWSINEDDLEFINKNINYEIY